MRFASGREMRLTHERSISIEIFINEYGIMNKELGSDSRPYEAVSEMRGGFKIEVRKPQGYDHFEIYFPQTSKIINTGSGDSEEAKKVFKRRL